jgi:hypothetical protein
VALIRLAGVEHSVRAVSGSSSMPKSCSSSLPDGTRGVSGCGPGGRGFESRRSPSGKACYEAVSGFRRPVRRPNAGTKRVPISKQQTLIGDSAAGQAATNRAKAPLALMSDVEPVDARCGPPGTFPGDAIGPTRPSTLAAAHRWVPILLTRAVSALPAARSFAQFGPPIGPRERRASPAKPAQPRPERA